MSDRIRKIIHIVAYGYAGFLAILALMPFWPYELWWLANVVQFVPLYVLCFPVIVLLILARVLRSWKIAFVQIISALLIFFGIMRFEVNLMPAVLGGADRPEHGVRVVSMNIGKDWEIGKPFNVEKFLAWMREVKPDIIALQEAGDRRLLERIEKEFPEDIWYGAFEEGGFFLISRMPVYGQSIAWSGRRALSKFLIKADGYLINYYTVHLMTPRYGLDPVRQKGLSEIQEIKRITKVQEAESMQAYEVIRLDHHRIVSGDFNLTTQHPIYRAYWRGFTNVFSKRGLGRGLTKDFPFHGIKGFRIDHVLVDESWEVLRAWVGPSMDSDHRPVVTDLRFIGVPNVVNKPDPPRGQGTEADIFYDENFAQGSGEFSAYGTGDLIMDAVNGYFRGNALRVAMRPGAQDLRAGVKFNLWAFEVYPVVRFFYRIPAGVGVCFKVKTRFDDWIALAGVSPKACDGVMPQGFVELTADDQWHEAVIDVEAPIRSILSGIRHLDELMFTIKEPVEGNSFFWIQEFGIKRQTD
jgi:endonuclease/exonuclease/phosphatase family metal-dependent hydrolase